MIRAFLIILLIGSLFLPAAVWAQTKAPKKGSKDVEIHIQLIDKVAGRPEILKTDVGAVAKYQSLTILPKRCVVNSNNEYAALIEVYDLPPSGQTQQLFSGWMFSANPSITYIEHPFYDVSLSKCQPRKEEKAKEE